MRRSYPTKRQYERSLYRTSYLAQSVAANRAAAQRERDQNAQPVPTDATNPAAVLRALVLQQPVERTPEGLRVVSIDAETDARGEP